MGIGSWFRRLLGGGGEGAKGAPQSSSSSGARWLEVDDPGNPFGVRLLDLMANLQMISTSRDPDTAARAVGWGAGMHRQIGVSLEGVPHRCELRYPAASELPDGLLYRPRQMEDKWVIAYRDGRVAAARSWTGETKAVATARHDGDALSLTELRFASDSGLDVLGDPVAAFDWLVRSHALGSRIPFPVSADGAAFLEAQPLSGFSFYGRQLFCAAVDYELGTPSGRLHSDGDLVAAVASGEAGRVRSALAGGAPVNAPCTFNEGTTVLHLAILLHPELVDPLLAAGADVNAASLHGSTPLMAAASADASRELIARLVEAGANVLAADLSGFTAAHVAAQFGSVAAIEALVAHGASLSATTHRGLTPLHVAAGTGKRNAVDWLVTHGVDPNTPSPLGDPLSIALEEGHQDVADLLKARRRP